MLDLFAAHEKDVEYTSEGDGSERDETTGDELRVRRKALEAWDSSIETVCDTARCADGKEVRLDDCRCSKWGGFVGVGVVDGDIERLVGYLPAECSRCLLLFSTYIVPFQLACCIL